MSTCFLVRDMNGKAAANVQVVAQWEGKQKSAVSGSDAVARFDEDIPSNAVILVPGYGTATRTPCQQPPTPPPTVEGETGRDRIKYCTRVAYNKFGQNWCDVTHPKYGTIYSGIPCREAYDKARVDPRCAEPYEEITTTTTGDGEEKGIDALRGIVEGLSKAVDGVRNAQDALQRAFDAFKDGLYDWLVEHVINAILQAGDNMVRGEKK